MLTQLSKPVLPNLLGQLSRGGSGPGVLKNLLDKGDAWLRDFEGKNVTLVEKFDYLTILLEDDPGQMETVESLRYSHVG